MNIGFLIGKIIRLITMKSRISKNQTSRTEEVDTQKIVKDNEVMPEQSIKDTKQNYPVPIVETLDYSDHYELNHLVLERFCGEEEYPLATAEYYICAGDGTEDDPYALWLEMKFSEGIKLSEDTADLQQEPNWEVRFSTLSIKFKDLKPGLILDFSNEEEDSEALMYYCEHIPTLNNRMEILDVQGNAILIKVTALATDVNYYDGSKPLNQLRVLAWFKLKGARN